MLAAAAAKPTNAIATIVIHIIILNILLTYTIVARGHYLYANV